MAYSFDEALHELKFLQEFNDLSSEKVTDILKSMTDTLESDLHPCRSISTFMI